MPATARQSRPKGPLPGVPGGVPAGGGASGELPPGDPRRAASLARNWWALAGRGVAGLVFAIAAVLLGSSHFLLLLTGYLFIDGLFALLAGTWRAERRVQWGAMATDGLAGMLLAGLLLLWPELPREVLLWLLIVWALVTGVMELLVAQGLGPGRRPAPRAGDMPGVARRAGIAAGISLGTGVLLALGPPDAARWLLAAYGLGFGAALLAWSLALRRQRDRLGSHLRMVRRGR